MPRQASIRRSRPWPFSSGSSSKNSFGVAIRSCILVTPCQQDGPAVWAPGVSWFTFRDLFLRRHLRPICAPRTWSVEPRDYGRPSSPLDEVSPRSAVREEAIQVRVSGSSKSDAREVFELSSGALHPLTDGSFNVAWR